MVDGRIFELTKILTDFEQTNSPFKEYIQNHVPMLEDLLDFYKKSDGETKKKILSCIIQEKIYFDEKKDAAITFTQPIEILINTSKVLEKSKNKKEVKNDLLSNLAPQSGLEPETL